MRQRRAALGLPHGDDAPLLIDADGNRIPSAQVPLHLRRARLQRVGIESQRRVLQGPAGGAVPSGRALITPPRGRLLLRAASSA